MDKYSEMTTPLDMTPTVEYKEADFTNAYIGQRVRGSEVIPCSVWKYRTVNGQY